MKIIHGDCLEKLAELDASSIHACVTDPPYHLTTGKKGGSGPASVNLDSPYGRARVGTGFMGMKWDGGDIAQRPETWAAVLRVLKPGAHLLAFGGTRTHHRVMCAIEDAGFEIRDMLMWVYGSGFPKSLNVAKAIDKAGETTEAAKQWNGWGTALKPAWEPIILARKPMVGTVAQNVQAHGCGAINVNGCRIKGEKAGVSGATPLKFRGDNARPFHAEATLRDFDLTLGRWPANVVHDGSEEVLAGFPDAPPGAARFFYCPKADRQDRNEGTHRGEENQHPTVKPTDLMRWLCRLVTPPGGVVLDPFMGSGSTGKAAEIEGFDFMGIELDADYIEIAKRRIAGDTPLFREPE